MTDRPIIFSAPMVRALLAGRKTQTRRIAYRRVVTHPDCPPAWLHGEHDGDGYTWLETPWMKAKPGDQLWVRENFTIVPVTAYRCSDSVQQTVNPDDRHDAAIYAAGWDRSIPKWRPSIHMPRWASRLTLVVSEVRVQRLQEISEGDALAEGIFRSDCFEGYSSDHEGRHYHGSDPARSFESLWGALHGDGAWDANPWVVAVTFAVHRANIDALKVPA